MTFARVQTHLNGDVPGVSFEFTYFTAGPADAPRKVYLQAALHADEQPGTMVLHHLLPLIEAADANGQLAARFVIVPMVNPLGMANLSFRHHAGRYDPNSGVNYNRKWPDLFRAVGADLTGTLTSDAAANLSRARAAVAGWIAAQTPRTAAERLRLKVMALAHDADIVLDLHCDDDSLIHIFTSPEMMPGLQDLADWMGSAATLTAADSGGSSFDEVLPVFFRQLAAANPSASLPMPVETATLEYRGQADVFDALGRDDARRLFGFLAGRGLIKADPGPKPAPMPGATPLEATEVLRVPTPGMLAYKVELGDRVRKGQTVAELIALDGPLAFSARTPIVAGTDGFILSRVSAKYRTTGANIAKIVGTEPLAGRKGGYLLED
jgi:uncharacterized protein